MKKVISLILINFIATIIYSQDKIELKAPLKIIAKEKFNSDIKTGSILFLTEINYYVNYNEVSKSRIKAKNEKGEFFEIESRKLNNFHFLDTDDVSKIWDKHLLINETYSNLIKNGFQYDLRNDLSSESIDYINSLSINDCFYNDVYFEDYLYTLINKIHNSTLNDNRPGNLFVKILRRPVPNAFSLPNGCIIVSTGLLSTIQSEDELIGILAHEVAHFVLDHHVLNFNKEIDRKKRAEFWSTFATVIAAGAETYLAVNDRNYIPGMLTTSTAIMANTLSSDVINRLGAKYSQTQEFEADYAAKDILKVLKYDSLGLSVALLRIKKYCTLTGDYLALSGGITHPNLDVRIGSNENVNLNKYNQSAFLKKVSLINSYNAWIELWNYAHHQVALDLANRNLTNGVATETDYITKSVILRRQSNSRESNEEALSLLGIAKLLNVTPYIIVHKEEGLTYIRLGNKVEAKKSFQVYLSLLNDLSKGNDLKNHQTNSKELENEIAWTKIMIFKIDKL